MEQIIVLLSKIVYHQTIIIKVIMGLSILIMKLLTMVVSQQDVRENDIYCSKKQEKLQRSVQIVINRWSIQYCIKLRLMVIVVNVRIVLMSFFLIIFFKVYRKYMNFYFFTRKWILKRI